MIEDTRSVILRQAEFLIRTRGYAAFSYADLAAHQVYACGAPVMVESAKRDFVENCRLPADGEWVARIFRRGARIAGDDELARIDDGCFVLVQQGD